VNFAGLWHYWIVIALMMIGMYTMIARENLVKKIMGLNLFQVSVILFYVSLGKVAGGTAPILIEGAPQTVYSNPLPHVLMLTAIVVGVAVTAVGLALVVRIQAAYGTSEDAELAQIDRADEADAALARGDGG
jgi:multicomponent Na+:H+ antiporter subunit C